MLWERGLLTSDHLRASLFCHPLSSRCLLTHTHAPFRSSSVLILILRFVLVLCEQTNPKYWDDEDAETVDDAYGDDWEKVAAFAYDNVEYSMVKILEPVLILAKEDPVSQCA